MIRFAIGDKIKIRKGNKLHNFKGDYQKHYIVFKCYFDETHEIEFVEFVDSNIKYCYPTAAFECIKSV